MSALTRREFLKIAANTALTVAGALGLGALGRLLSHPTQPLPKTEFDIGPAAAYPMGSRTLLPDIPAVLIHREAGFAALSLVCTHLGCTVEQQAAGFACRCHGSHFSDDGAVQRGPAQAPLTPLRVEQTADGGLVVYRS
jgi:nitrite reductase/ring-hydroxylating ferredoxin subunit